MMSRLRTIRARLTLWYVLLLGITLLSFGLYVFVQMRSGLFGQVDAALQTAAAQALGLLTAEDDQLRFVPQLDQQVVTANLLESGVGVRLVDSTGTALDGFGSYRVVPGWAPRQPGYATLAAASDVWRVYSYPLQLRGDQVTLWLQASQSLSGLYDTLDRLLTLMLLGVPFVLLMAAAGGLFLADRALRPVDRITRTAEGIDSHHLDQRLNHSGPPDELYRLAQTFDRMLDRLDAAFAAERRFTADASHELRTPLTVIKGHLEVGLNRARTPEEYQEILRTVRAEADRLIRLANNLLYLARLDAAPVHPQFEPVDLNALLTLVADQAHLLAEERSQQLRVDLSELPTVYGSADHLIRLFLNLLDNAVKYTPTGGQIALSAACEAAHVTVTIADTGCGIAPEQLPHIFERFYRAPGRAPGTGLGLAIAQSIAREHGGRIEAASRLGEGSVFTVYLPVKEKRSALADKRNERR
jgi:heavy metal sensor kinase